MTFYQGGKKRIGLDIATVIHNISTEIESQTGKSFSGYCEPFCGMLGVYKHIPTLFKDHKPKLKYLAGDRNEDVIIMWKAVQKGWKPPSKVTKEDYNKMKTSPKKSPRKSFVGFAASMRGKYFGGYLYRNNISHQASQIKNMSQTIQNVEFTYGDYTQYSTLKNCIIYCDPPYEGTQCYFKNNGNVISFNNEKFYDWCKKMSKNNLVFVSEYNMPREFKKVWSKGNEKLFVC